MAGLALYILLVNIFALGLIGYDKGRAERGFYRTPEKVFFILALLGGAAGIFLGMNLFRHKTRKILFAWGVPLLLFFNLACLYFVFRYISAWPAWH